MRITAFITLVTSFMLFTCASALVINKNQGEGSIRFDHASVSAHEQSLPNIQARRIGGGNPVGQCERPEKCAPRNPDDSL
ncbi:hypothetical protein BDF21DRAFT_496247 [Thamnidium elegans]|uniref:Lipoprotein n=1 Tax=Thamnidium elegans TaxID=101142 RepID=A0A8H7W0R6_9FUNG|nr:hypothetical protein INT48_001968 [Thamnidium elegans]KAI8067351.1 hypothetical protein BDF21DRAFT_496247 [Thamnidium elegans]